MAYIHFLNFYYYIIEENASIFLQIIFISAVMRNSKSFIMLMDTKEEQTAHHVVELGDRCVKARFFGGHGGANDEETSSTDDHNHQTTTPSLTRHRVALPAGKSLKINIIIWG